MADNARILLWGSMIGAVSWVPEREIGVFQYAPEFIESGIQPSPIEMPLQEFPYSFPALPKSTFKGLPGMLADSLPDRFGNAVIDSWLAEQGRSSADFHPVERLCYIGKRGMGALEFEPAIQGPMSGDSPVHIAALTDLANHILAERRSLHGVLRDYDDNATVQAILQVGTSAGGARAKAVLAWNPVTGEFRSGQTGKPDGFEDWLLKFDGVHENRDRELNDPMGFGKIEFAYSQMARDAGIVMTDCRLFNEGGRSHFMTRRFDRGPGGSKLHMQSLGSMAHFDYDQPGAYSYEQALQIMRRMRLPQEDLEQLVLRAFFNVAARNQDDHVKNIAFLMDKAGSWRLSPAYDITFACNPHGHWTNQHQMSIHGKRGDFTLQDLRALASTAGLKPGKTAAMIDRVLAVIRTWPEYAHEAGVAEDQMDAIDQLLLKEIRP
ncbi:type II toxin-antitoxin system HipA family toxin [Spirochaeta dissipatitropha]